MATDTITQKSCSKCNQAKPVSEFYKHPTIRNGLRSQCKECVQAYRERPDVKQRTRDWFQKNKTRILATRKATRKTQGRRYRPSSESRRRHALQWKYGLTVEQYDSILEQQEGTCAICRNAPKSKPLVVDHCHRTQKVRGLLCNKCNISLGGLGDNIEGIMRAVEYLERAEERTRKDAA